MSDAAAQGAEHPSPHRHRVNVALLLTAVAAAPAAWITQLLLGYGVSSFACYPHEAPALRAPPPGWGGESGALLAVNLVCLALAIAGGAWCARDWRRSRAEKGGDAESLLEVGEGRTRFLAGCGLLAATGFVVAILFDTALPLVVASCWNIPR